MALLQVILASFDSPGWVTGWGFRRIVEARRVDQVAAALASVDAAADLGLWAVGFVAYEAAGGLDEHLATHAPVPDLPLVWFALFDELVAADPPADRGDFQVGPWQPDVTNGQYDQAIGTIKELIAAGDTYQVNYTLRLHSRFEGSSESLFARLVQAQPSDCCAFIDTGRWAICSASPELFFELNGAELASRPMKGTARRGLWPGQDHDRRQQLARSAKDRAENAMIVDMIRNDVGRIARPHSVRVRDVFAVETYPTVHQMTSTVTCRTGARLADIMAAMFPCASVTGAPKVRTMQIIRDLEPTPRGVYTGAIGCWGPGRRGRFNVAIRTVVIDRQAGSAQYGVGGGIVWDSRADLEYAECQAKAAVLTARRPRFELLETLRLEADGRYVLLEGHLARLGESAEYFGWRVDLEAVRRALADHAGASQAAQRVRLLVGHDGRIRVEFAAAPVWEPTTPWRLRLAETPVQSDDVFLYHKTTQRDAYERAYRSRGDCDDVLLYNERGELTETTLANIVLDLDGQLVTPPVWSGVLGGVMRSSLLASGRIVERVCTLDDLPRCRAIYVINSVRGQWPAVIADSQHV